MSYCELLLLETNKTNILPRPNKDILYINQTTETLKLVQWKTRLHHQLKKLYRPLSYLQFNMPSIALKLTILDHFLYDSDHEA